MMQGPNDARSNFNRLFRLGVKEVGDIVDAQSQRILGFVEARHLLGIPPSYGFNLTTTTKYSIDARSLTSTQRRTTVE